MSRQHEFLQGLRDMPFGIIYGSLAGAAGLDAWQTVGMSVLVSTIAIAVVTRHLLATIGGGLVIFFLLRWTLGLLPI
ncbi:hypothetical protein [Phytopseudomonas seleniipraecipitans]|uniref:hypothetical protein n=1 Tax=Phytopseudomonas seleniipraecipitans TaxID=640205 RepID=UPI0009F20592